MERERGIEQDQGVIAGIDLETTPDEETLEIDSSGPLKFGEQGQRSGNRKAQRTDQRRRRQLSSVRCRSAYSGRPRPAQSQGRGERRAKGCEEVR